MCNRVILKGIGTQSAWKIMTINSDSIRPVTAATVTVSQSNGLVRVEFDCVLDQELLDQGVSTDIVIVGSNQGVSTDLVIAGSSYQLEAIAEAIAQMLEQRGLSVKRLTESSVSEAVSSFTAQPTQEDDRDV